MIYESDILEVGFWGRLKKERRRRVKRCGIWLSRKLRNYLSSQSLVEDQPVLDNEDFPFLEAFTENWQEIRAEAKEILKHRDAIPKFVDVSPDQMKISQGNDWKTFFLFGFGTKLERNARQAPRTIQLLERVPNLQTAWFSILGAHSHIPAHKGVTKGILRCHLGLVIPREQDKCRMRLKDTICVWRPGQLFVFDDTYEHEVWNETDEERVILLFDFDRPMRLPGRLAHKVFLKLLKLTAYYRDPKKNMQSHEDQFEAAIRRNNELLETREN